MQAPHQDSLPDDCVKKTFSMPYISDVNDEYHAIRVVNEVILELCHEGNGPVQLCIPWLDFEISGQSPDIRKISSKRCSGTVTGQENNDCSRRTSAISRTGNKGN